MRFCDVCGAENAEVHHFIYGDEPKTANLCSKHHAVIHRHNQSLPSFFIVREALRSKGKWTEGWKAKKRTTRKRHRQAIIEVNEYRLARGMKPLYVPPEASAEIE